MISTSGPEDLATPASSNSSLRIVSGIVLYALVTWVILGAHAYFMLGLLAIVAVLIGWEWLGMALPENKHRKYLAPLLLLPPLLSYLALEYTAYYPIVKYYVTSISGIWFAWALLRTANYELNPTQPVRSLIQQILAVMNAIILISIFIYFALLLYASSPELAFAVITMVCFCDTGGYIFGRWLGGKKLTLNLSPNKTFSGAIGSTLLVIGSYVVMAMFFDSLPLNMLMIILLIPFAVMLQCGDLYQSMLKRQASIKDSGNIIPGHGGIFDRADGLLWGSFSFYIILTITQILSPAL